MRRGINQVQKHIHYTIYAFVDQWVVIGEETDKRRERFFIFFDKKLNLFPLSLHFQEKRCIFITEDIFIEKYLLLSEVIVRSIIINNKN